MINGRSKSILLQVAFKEASSADSLAEIKLLTSQYYTMLLELHDELNIDPEDGAFKRGGNSGGRSNQSTFTPPVGETFIYNSVLVEDFRAAKAAPGSSLKPNWPDFKTVEQTEIAGVTNNKGAAWLYAQDGTPVEATAALVTAADSKVM